jgi:carbon-monoxide dehydrogenase large subunit
MDRQGRVTVYTGSSPHGQGHETAFAQLASQEFGIPLERVTVVWGDTAQVPVGIGTFGSRSAATGGSAVVDASRKLKSKLLEEASKVLETPAESLVIRGGEIFSKRDRQQQTPLLSLESLLEKLNLNEASAESVFDLKSMVYSSGAHLCALTLDVESGKVEIARYVVVEDCGRMINRVIVEGQLHGGVIHGVGGALLEKLEYDPDGNLLSTSLMDYCIPSAVDSPGLELFHETTPSKVTLDGAKGVGESGTIGSYAAIINALNDAISQAGSSVQLNIAPSTFDSIYSALIPTGEES